MKRSIYLHFALNRGVENIELLTEAGANVVYDYYDSVGIGLAKMTLETQSGPVANELAPDKSGPALSIPIEKAITGTNTMPRFLFNP